MAKKSAARRIEEAEGTDPSRPDNIPSQAGDESERIESFNADAAVIDVNGPARDEDARSDAEKEEERRAKAEQEDREARATEGREDPPRRERGRRPDPESEDEADLTRKMSRRVNRERELRRQSDEQVSNLAVENKKLADRLAKLERGGGEKEIEGTIAQLEAKINEIKTKLEAAIEAGVTKDQMALTIELGEVQGRLMLAKRDLEVAKKAPAETEDPGAKQPVAPSTPPLVKDWLAANKRWWNLPSFKALQSESIALDKLIKEEIKDGDLDFEEYSEEHMDELSRRLAKAADRMDLDVEIRDFNGDVFDPDAEEEREDPEPRRNGRERTAANGRDKGREVRGNNGGRSPQGGMGGRDGRRGAQSDLELARQGKARLTDKDYAQMRVYKLDPNDPATRKAFAKERVRTILTEAQKGAR